MGNLKSKAMIRGGLLCLAAALCLVGYNLWDARRASESAAEILRRLEAKGFITFAVDEADRRCHRIIPTELALQAHRQAAEGLDAVERQLLAGFSPEEAAQFHDYLARAAANIGTCSGTPSPEQQEETSC